MFLNLDYEKLLLCQKVNEFWKEKLNIAMFLAEKWIVSTQHTLEWLKLIKQPILPFCVLPLLIVIGVVVQQDCVHRKTAAPAFWTSSPQ